MSFAYSILRHGFVLGVGIGVLPTVVAGGLSLSVQVPKIDVLAYDPPYLAAWLEGPDKQVVTTLTVWYGIKQRNNGGAKYLNELRQWWRKAGRDLKTPIDGVTGPTYPPGEYALDFTEGTHPLPKLPAGSYTLMVEVSREMGGHELLKLPFDWPVKKAASISDKGKVEVGTVTLGLKP